MQCAIIFLYRGNDPLSLITNENGDVASMFGRG